MKKVWLIFSAVLSVSLAGCGGGAGGGLSGEKEPAPQPVAVNIVETSAIVEVSKTFQFHYSVDNTTYPTCTWTVDNVAGGNSSVGTITSEGLYTAPAVVPNPNQVTIKATATADTTKSDTASITISPKLVISPSTATVNLGATLQFSGNIAVDAWRVNDVLWGSSSVGTISQSGLYTAPAALPNPNTVTVSGWSNAQNESATATVTLVNPKMVAVTPLSVTVPAGANQQFIADKDVTWSLAGSAGATTSLGSISSAGIYTAPLSPPMGGVVTVVATLKSDSTAAGTSSATIVFSNASLQGHYAFRYRSAESGDMAFSAGSFVADGAGAIADGYMMMNSPQGVSDGEIPFSGTYQVTPDGKAMVSLLILGDPVSLRFILTSNTSARIIGFGEGETGAGTLDQQDASALAKGLSGTYVFTFDGMKHACPGSVGPRPVAAVGRFTATDQGLYGGDRYIANGTFDQNENGKWAGLSGDQNFEGSYSFNPVTGSGDIQFETGNAVYPGPITYFKYYVVSADLAVFVAIDRFSFYPDGCGWGVNGVLVRQDSTSFSNASLSGSFAAPSWGYLSIPSSATEPFSRPSPVFSAGVVNLDGNGNISGGTLDNNVNGTVNQSMPASGTYSVASNGRGIGMLIAAGGHNQQVFYMTSPNSGFSVGVDTWGPAVGQYLPQSGAKPYSIASVGGRFAFQMRGTLSSLGNDAVGQLILDSKGGLTGTLDINQAGILAENVPVTGTYTIDSVGRGALTINAQNLLITMNLNIQNQRIIILMGTSSPSLGYLLKQY
jgi:hypothetical protein